MKYLKTAPKETGFFEIYARLSKSIRRSGMASQLVSGLTEIGGIYAATYVAIYPVMPKWAVLISSIVAIIGTIVIEGGLRQLMPKSVDAILYRRFKGLHLPMSIAILSLTGLLLLTSGYLSFSNSKLIVKEMTPPAALATTGIADSMIMSQKQELLNTYSTDTAQLNQQLAIQLVTAKDLASSKESAAKRELSNWYNREKRSGQSFGTRKDEVRQKLSNIKAEAAAEQSRIQSAHLAALQSLKSRYHQDLDLAKTKYEEGLSEVKQSNTAAVANRDQTVANYGGGLGWFTVVCLLLFTASVILDRIHCKGSGIEDKVELSQYDLNPSVISEAIMAISERINYLVYDRITAFAEKTPAAPLPALGSELYDPAELAQLEVKLEIKKEAGDTKKVIQLEPKRRLIGFNREEVGTGPVGVHTHEISCAIKGTPNNMELARLKQRLKLYKKRLGKHQQKAIAQEKKNGEVTGRTQQAIQNNTIWVEKYEQLVQEAEANFKIT